jgi:hypothetical protein
LCLNLAPEVNLLKNVSSKSKFDSKEVKRFVFLIVIPAPKPLPGLKKEPEEKVMADETESSMKIKRADLTKTPEPSAKASIPKADKFLPPKRPGPDIVKDSDHYFNRTIFYQQSRG